MRIRQAFAAVVVLALVAVTGGCGGDDDPTLDVGGSARSTTTTTEAHAIIDEDDVSDIGDVGGPFATTAVSTPPERRGLLVDVRHARHGDVHRVVFQFEGAVPGYDVKPATRPIVQDGSGHEIAVAGDQVILAEFEPSSGVDLQGEDAVETYTGPRRIAVEQSVVAELVQVGDFEAQLVWALGVKAGSRFRVTALDAPPRVVVDVRSS